MDAASQRRADEVVHRLGGEEGGEAGGDDAPGRADHAVELLSRERRMRVDEERDVAGEEGRADEAEADQQLRVDRAVAAGRAAVVRELDEGERDADRVDAAGRHEVREREADELLRADLRREDDGDVQPRQDRQSHSGRRASASISTFQAGLSVPVMTSIAEAGRISPNTSPCARPTASQSAGSTM